MQTNCICDLSGLGLGLDLVRSNPWPQLAMCACPGLIVELELTPGEGDYGREAAAAAFEGAGERVANDEGANDADGEDTLGNKIDLVYDEVIRKNEPLSVGAGYDQIDISDGSVERKEEPSLQSYLTNLGGAIEELLVGSKDPNKDEGTVTEPPKQDEPVSAPVREGEGQESKLMKEDEDTVGRLLKDDVGSTGVLVEEVVVKRVEKRSSATMRGSPGRKNLTSLLTSASDDLEESSWGYSTATTCEMISGDSVVRDEDELGARHLQRPERGRLGKLVSDDLTEDGWGSSPATT